MEQIDPQIKPTSEVIDLEIEEEFRRNPSNAFNNFFCNLPGGIYRIRYEQSLDKEKTNRQLLGSLANEDWHSTLYLDQNQRDFFKIVDEITDKLGLRETIERLQEEKRQSMRTPKEQRKVSTRELDLRLRQLSRPIYKELRLRGYEEYDLIA